ncbi:hypothetical protein HYH03_015054 [Edaphochlamys debaryana]|uniref:Glycosyltransferase family 92 protein n=1 Tax=Edaphochlamys debaryana TaxID=47281 RepID=A0A835XUQ4_9CHLO|nr:hypothetical protein HYH03_015054 [Edaphochlamys debaryana]|eukprot:KAG2486229.1 hypothetical protein HYH03_015054 [Edaphochlamys debaryana]
MPPRRATYLVAALFLCVPQLIAADAQDAPSNSAKPAVAPPPPKKFVEVPRGGNHLLHQSEPGYLAACLVVKDGNGDIREWIEYHLWAGVDKIFLFDHNSSIPMLRELEDYVVAGKVQYTYLTSELPKVKKFADGLQGRVFGQCLSQAKGYYKWLTDLDELMMVTDPAFNGSIPAVLRDYESNKQLGALIIHRVIVGSGGVQSRQRGQGMLETFTKCIGRPGEHVKGIVRPEYAEVGGNAHYFFYAPGRNGIRIGDNKTVGHVHMVSNPTAGPLLIYHYSGSIDEQNARVKRNPEGVSGMTSKDPRMLAILDARTNATCLLGRQAHDRMAAAGARSLGPRPLPAEAQAAAQAAVRRVLLGAGGMRALGSGLGGSGRGFRLRGERMG